MKPGDEGLVPPGTTVLVSGFDLALGGRGGLFAWDGHRLTKIDDVNTTGMHLHGGDLVRCAWNTERDHADLVVTDIDGRHRSCRIDGVGNPHDVLTDGHLVAVVATEQNEIAWFRRDGERVRTWRPEPAAESDSWHLNSLVRHRGRLLVGAFGRFTRRKEWDLLGRPASGCVVDVDTGAVVLDGLRAPHTPRFVGGGEWLVCNSGDGELVALESGRQRRVLAKFDGWPRGLLVTRRAVFVGISPDRKSLRAPAPTSRVVALDPASWEPMAEVEIAAREIYDLVLAPQTLAAAMSQRRSRQQTSSKTGR